MNASEDVIVESRKEPHRLYPDICKTAIANQYKHQARGRRSTPFWRVRQDYAASRKIWFMDEVIKGIQLEDMTASQREIIAANVEQALVDTVTK